jgi:hypothetical protein
VDLLQGWNAEHTLEALALLGAGVAFLVGLLQYKKAQRWKRAEWVAQEMKAFLDNPQVDAAFKMVDWGGRPLSLFPLKEGSDRLAVVSASEITEALRPHGKGCCFNETEIAIRDAFDALCDGLERFESYIRTGLITPSDVEPYLDYWGLHLRPDSPDPKLRRIREFMAHYGWDGATGLLDRFRPRGSAGTDQLRFARDDAQADGG